MPPELCLALKASAAKRNQAYPTRKVGARLPAFAAGKFVNLTDAIHSPGGGVIGN